jgi:Family of unknown function (DUF5691)
MGTDSVAAPAGWDELASAALLGSQRGVRTGSLPPAELLDAAAVLAVARRAGIRPRRIAPQDLGSAASTPAEPAGSETATGSAPAQDGPGSESGPEPGPCASARSGTGRLDVLRSGFAEPDPQTGTTQPDTARDLARSAPALATGPRLTRPDPMPVDPRPLISPAAALRLRAILDGYQKYLPEWLATARATGCRIPPVFFPELLDLTRNNALIRADVTELLGGPGRWLAALNPSWAFFLRPPADPPLPASAPVRRVAAPVADFTAEARRLLGRPKNSNDLYNLVMRQPGLWPEEGVRLLIEYVAAHRYPVVNEVGLRIDGGMPTARSSDWAIEQLQRTIGDHAPLHLRRLVQELLEEPPRPGAEATNPVVDLYEILDALTFRADMHEELNARRRTPAHPEGRSH